MQLKPRRAMASKLTHLFEPPIVVLNCHGQLQQLPQQVLGVAEGDSQFTRSKFRALRQAEDCLWWRESLRFERAGRPWLA